MPLTTSSKTLLTIFISGFFVVIIVGYALFSARHLLAGPVIEIQYPHDGDVLSSNFLEIRGVTENLNYVSLNDRQIFIDSDGNFKEKLLLYPGVTIIKLYGKDKFNRDITRYVRVVAPESTSTLKIINQNSDPTIASSTQSVASTTNATSTHL